MALRIKQTKAVKGCPQTAGLEKSREQWTKDKGPRSSLWGVAHDEGDIMRGYAIHVGITAIRAWNSEAWANSPLKHKGNR
ncbi:hypothetical protein ColLi_05974 [Colletotrichum liriopes]|uniref:Uncharacterized protein n=1 Tax=Colletotrichum liriopes TaxID=708192 RepID=A0AA37GMN7_9PEZI|nr:hypothetical protein ColLi_05974 [Colletotrichum liriopes]